MEQKRDLTLGIEGFLLIELMVVISIIGILMTLGIPSYRTYTQRAAMLEVLQRVMPYKLEIELACLEKGEGGVSKSTIDLVAPEGITEKGPLKELSIGPTGDLQILGGGVLEGLSITLQPECRQGSVCWQAQYACSDPYLQKIAEKTFRFLDIQNS